MTVPSAWKLEQAMATFEAARTRDEIGGDDDNLAAMLDAQADVEELLDATIRAALEAEAFSKSVKSRIDDLAERKKRFDLRAERLRATAFAVMDILGEKKRQRGDFTASIGQGKPAVLVTDEDQIPAEYFETKRTLRKAALNDAILKHNETVAGAELTNGAPVLTIRSK